MSHDATGWAIKQRGLKPATKIVLWQLCDRYHPDNGCFPSQDTLAADCEMSRSSVNEHLTALEEASLIAREQRRDGPTNRQKSTRYRFAFEDGFAALKAAGNKESPCPESGHGAVSGKSPEPCPENGESRVQNPDTNLVREPVSEPLRESASEDSKQEEANRDDAKKVEAEGWALLKNWPGFDGMPKEPAMRIWRTLSADERALARRCFLPWLTLLKAQRKTHVPAPATYLKEKLWQAVPDPAEAPAAPVLAAPFGKAWGARRMAVLLAGSGPLPAAKGFSAQLIEAGGEMGRREELSRLAVHGFPEVNRMHQLAADGKGWTLKPETDPGETMLALMAQYRVGSDEYLAWKALHEERGWPWLPDPGRQQWVYFPAGGPDGLEAFQEAVSAGQAKDTQAVRGNHDAQQAAE